MERGVRNHRKPFATIGSLLSSSRASSTSTGLVSHSCFSACSSGSWRLRADTGGHVGRTDDNYPVRRFPAAWSALSNSRVTLRGRQVQQFRASDGRAGRPFGRLFQHVRRSDRPLVGNCGSASGSSPLFAVTSQTPGNQAQFAFQADCEGISPSGSSPGV